MALRTMLGGMALLTVLIATARVGLAMIAPILEVARAHEPRPTRPLRLTVRRLDHA
jgi:anaerobic C4-dicarboxylate transporter